MFTICYPQKREIEFIFAKNIKYQLHTHYNKEIPTENVNRN